MSRFRFKTAFRSRAVCLLLVGLFWLCRTPDADALTGEAQKIFKRNQQGVFQIQIIDVHSHEKSVIGSGFRISKEGHFATNYHVVSDVVDEPGQYRIEYHRDGKKIGKLELKAIDVAHDLAILKGDESNAGLPLKLVPKKPTQGSPVFPMGNPLDVGMVIIEGTYNGLVGAAPYQHILLSAALNPGMSGGPAFDSNGNVMGINVALEGNDLSYLVPVEYLIKLKEQAETKNAPSNWKNVIQTQVLQQFNHHVTQALKEKWEHENFGSLRVPKNVLPSLLKCWGRSKSEDIEKNQTYFISQKWCQSRYSIYLSSELETGTFGYGIYRLGSETLNPLQLYKEYAKEFSQTSFYSDPGEEEVSNFQCQNHFVKMAGHDWKGAYCVRRYIKYPQLHDVFLSFAILGDTPKKYIVQIGVTGVNEASSRRFLQKFLGGIQWAG